MTEFECLLACSPPPAEKTALSRLGLRAAVHAVERDPTPAQAEAGNYRQGHVSWKGLDLAIETPKGAYRRGVDAAGTAWATLMKDHYGRIKRTEGADGDQVDVFLCEDDLDSDVVFVVNQVNHDGFDEHKCILGTTNEARARDVYLRNYSKGWSGLGSVTAMTVDQFKWWLDHCDTTKEIEDGYFAAPANRRKKAAEDQYGNAYEFKGDVQGVHLRATLNRLLDRHHVGGLAWNDARSGDAFATVDAPEETRNQILAELAQGLAAGGRARHVEVAPVAGPTRMKAVDLDDAKLQRLFDRQGFTSYLGWEHDPAAYRRHWVQKRYRLAEDPTTRHLTGHVPDQAYRQLTGLEPVYKTQLDHPEQFARPYWMKELPPPGEPPAKEASAARLPRLLRVKRARAKDEPFTVAVDLDGTLAEVQEPFDPETIGPPREKAKYWLEAFRDAGAKIIIFTVRGNEALVRAWLDEHDMPYDHVNENPDQPEDGSGKVLADVYWDDRAVDATDVGSGAEVLRRIEAHGEEEAGTEPAGRGLCVLSVRVLLAPEDVFEEMTDAAADAGE